MYAIRDFVKEFLDPTNPMKILDVGSYDKHNPKKLLNCGRYLRKPPLWEYTGIDLSPGRNVDVVAKGPYEYPFEDGSFDLVISANTLEHTQDTHKFVKELARLSKDLVVIFVPNTRHEHKYPIDCWRVFPDGMKFLLEDIAGLEVIKVGLVGGEKLADTIGVARKKYA
jgi:hypothetical protein